MIVRCGVGGLLALMLALAGAPTAAANTSPIERARINYEAILRGEKTLFDLSPAEQQDVRELDKRIRAVQPPAAVPDDPFEACRDAEIRKLERPPTDLDLRVIDTRCR